LILQSWQRTPGIAGGAERSRARRSQLPLRNPATLARLIIIIII
jgi:hypothetical protein